ncbi:MAG: ATP-dependent zinc metalloprotease FtsH [Chloroflexi bacterium]|nr:ATP-dependent zinc metalloprotease FtsH [Chloroflexota bacterium]
MGWIYGLWDTVAANISRAFGVFSLLCILVFAGQTMALADGVIDLNQVAQDVKDGKVSSIVINGDSLTLTMKDGSTFTSQNEAGTSLTKTLSDYGVTPDQIAQVTLTVNPNTDSGIFGTLIWVLPLLLLAGLVLLIVRPSSSAVEGGPQDQVTSFAKSRAKKISPQQPNVTFDDVAGVDEAKQELVEVVEFLKQPFKFDAVGARIPKGVLMVGPPGTGKTLLARAVAGEAGVPFFSISGSEFVEMFVGVGASRVRDLFAQAKQNAPCIVFVDEIDAVGRSRGVGFGGGNDEREQTLNQILVEMDGFDQHDNIIVIAATNRPDILDQALLRPGRFDRRVTLELPDRNGRFQVLKVHSRSKPLDPSVDLERVAKSTPGFSGADLENVMNEAAILAARRNKQQISMAELEESVDRVIAGPERKSRVIGQREKKITAYHESGHALIAWVLPDLDPIHKISIVSRGESGGHTRLVPVEDRSLWTQDQLKSTLVFGMGGLVAEKLVFGETTTGPGSDLQKATEMARKMVTEFGMSKEIGPLVLASDGQSYPGRDIFDRPVYGDELANRIDSETIRFIREAKDRAEQLLQEHRDKLDKLAEALIEQETVQGDQLADILGPVPAKS